MYTLFEKGRVIESVYYENQDFFTFLNFSKGRANPLDYLLNVGLLSLEFIVIDL